MGIMQVFEAEGSLQCFEEVVIESIKPDYEFVGVLDSNDIIHFQDIKLRADV